MARETKKETALTPEEKLARALVPEAKQPYRVPKNWRWVRLGNVSSNQYGYTAKAIIDNTKPKMLRITDIQESGVDWSQVPNCEIGNEDLVKYVLQENDIVIARTGATTGKCYLISNPTNSVFASYLIRLRVNNIVLPHYTYFFLQTNLYWEQISELSSGIAQPGVNSSKLQTMVFPLPPLPEQQRIVDRIESLFAKLDEAKERIESVSGDNNGKNNAMGKIELMKKAILARAFRGELGTNDPTEESAEGMLKEIIKRGDKDGS